MPRGEEGSQELQEDVERGFEMGNADAPDSDDDGVEDELDEDETFDDDEDRDDYDDDEEDN